MAGLGEWARRPGFEREFRRLGRQVNDGLQAAEWALI